MSERARKEGGGGRWGREDVEKSAREREERKKKKTGWENKRRRRWMEKERQGGMREAQTCRAPEGNRSKRWRDWRCHMAVFPAFILVVWYLIITSPSFPLFLSLFNSFQLPSVQTCPAGKAACRQKKYCLYQCRKTIVATASSTFIILISAWYHYIDLQTVLVQQRCIILEKKNWHWDIFFAIWKNRKHFTRKKCTNTQLIIIFNKLTCSTVGSTLCHTFTFGFTCVTLTLTKTSGERTGGEVSGEKRHVPQ